MAAPATGAHHSPNAAGNNRYVTNAATGSIGYSNRSPHILDGVVGEQVAETADEDPARVVLVADAVSAYRLDTLDLDGTTWRASAGVGSAAVVAFATTTAATAR